MYISFRDAVILWKEKKNSLLEDELYQIYFIHGLLSDNKCSVPCVVETYNCLVDMLLSNL